MDDFDKMLKNLDNIETQLQKLAKNISHDWFIKQSKSLHTKYYLYHCVGHACIGNVDIPGYERSNGHALAIGFTEEYAYIIILRWLKKLPILPLDEEYNLKPITI